MFWMRKDHPLWYILSIEQSDISLDFDTSSDEPKEFHMSEM